jgi:hypothetical protein
MNVLELANEAREFGTASGGGVPNSSGSTNSSRRNESARFRSRQSPVSGTVLYKYVLATVL